MPQANSSSKKRTNQPINNQKGGEISWHLKKLGDGITHVLSNKNEKNGGWDGVVSWYEL